MKRGNSGGGMEKVGARGTLIGEERKEGHYHNTMILYSSSTQRRLSKHDASQYYLSRSRYSPAGGRRSGEAASKNFGFGSRAPRFPRGTQVDSGLCLPISKMSSSWNSFQLVYSCV